MFGKAIAVDDEHKTPADQPVPMTLEQTEPIHGDPHEMVLFLVIIKSVFLLFSLFQCLIRLLVL